MKPSNKSSSKFLFVGMVFLFSIEGLLVWGVFLRFLPLWAVVLSHFLIVGGFAVLLRKISNQGNDTRFPYLCVLMNFFLGPFGLLVSVISWLMYKIHNRSRASWSNLLEELFPEEAKQKNAELLYRILLGWEQVGSVVTSRSYYEIIRFGTEEQKQAAIEKMLDHFQPEFLPILKEALNDSSNAIRVQGATALRALEDQFSDQYLSLKERIEESPLNSILRLEFAKHCETWATSNLLSKKDEEQIFAESILAYQEYVKKHPKDDQTKLTLARLLLNIGEKDKACSLIDQCRLPNDQAAFLKMETLYSDKRFAEIKKMAKNLQPTSISMKNVVTLWEKEDKDATGLA